MADKPQWIIDITTPTFERDVIERSMQLPVVVDFWAPWCGPCRELTPLLERIVGEMAGRVLLAKVNVEECPEIASVFRVQSIPYVAAIRDGGLVNHFVGVLPEEKLREWFQSVLPSPVEEHLKQGAELEPTDPVAAERHYRDALSLLAEHDAARDAVRIALARVLAVQQRDDEARALIAELETRGFLEPEAEKVKSQLELRAAAAEAGGLVEARKHVAEAPDDLSRQVQLADALAVANKYEEALQICLAVVQRDRAGFGEEARTTMVRIFNMLPPGSELVSAYRRKLATAMY